MNAETLSVEIDRRTSEVTTLRKFWNSLIPTDCPDEYQFNIWLDLHTFDSVVYGVRETARKYRTLGSMTAQHMVRFASKCMNSHVS